MARNTLADRMTRLEQQRARLAAQEAKIKTEERKQRTRRLIEAGGLIEKAGLLALEANALFGALLSLAVNAADKDQVAKWEAEGGRAFDREAKARDEGKEPLVIALPSSQPAPVTTALRAAGFRWNKVMHHWEGLARHDDAQGLADRHGGTLRRLTPPTLDEAVPAAAE